MSGVVECVFVLYGGYGECDVVCGVVGVCDVFGVSRGGVRGGVRGVRVVDGGVGGVV